MSENYIKRSPANFSVTTWSAGSTGLTPSTPTKGPVVLDGVLNIAHGGTGATTPQAASEGLSTDFAVADLAALKTLTSRPEVVTVKTGSAAGTWQWVLGSSTTADDALVVQCTSGTAGRYKRIFDGPVYLEWFGADSTGVSDATTALTNAIAGAKTAGVNAVNCSGGKWKIDAGAVTLNNITLLAETPPDFGNTYGDSGGTFLLTSTTTSPFTLEQGWALRGLTFYYPNATGAENPPTVYPPLFVGTYVAGGVMEDCTILNAYQGFKFNIGTAVGDFRLDRCRIYCIDRVFWFLGQAPEVINISDCIFSYGLYVPSYTPNAFMQTRTKTVGEFCRIDISGDSVDGFDMSNTIVFGYRYGIRILAGALNVSNIEGNWFDQVGTALSVEGTSSITSTRISDNYFWSATPGDTTTDYPTIALSSSSQLSNLTITGNDFANSQGDHIQWATLATQDVQIVANHFRNWGRRTGGAPATYYAINATDAAMDGCISANRFQPVSGSVAHARNGIGIGNAADVAILVNEFDDCFVSLVLVTATKIKIIGNVSAGTGHTASFTNSAAAGVVEAVANLWDKAPSGPTGFSSFAVAAGTQTFTGAKTQVNFGTVTFDRDNNFATNTFTAPVNGDYEFDVQLNNTTGLTAADVWLLTIEATGSGTAAVVSSCYVPANTAAAAPIRCRAKFALVAGDAVKVHMTRNSGAGNYVSINDGTFNTFVGKRVMAT